MATLNFKGKSFVQNYHLTVKYHQLVPKPSESLTRKVSLNDNLIIHGDNLAALKALLPTYGGKVKCVIIDPPYNTGNEQWVYNDNVNSPMMQEWLGKVVDKEDLTRHDKWLCMMMPRLKLLWDLLKDDGAIFVCIDDNEAHRLKALMDEIFGEENFLADIAWKKRSGGGQDAEYFSPVYDHILSYRKRSGFQLKDELLSQDVSIFKFDEKTGQYYQLVQLEKWGRNSRREDRPNLCYPITAPDKSRVLPRNGEGNWRWGKSRVEKGIAEGTIVFERRENEWKIYEKKIVSDTKWKRPETLWLDKGSNPDGSKVLKELFGGTSPFDHPKPVELFRYILTISTDTDSLVLDSFAGSGTTGHAVLEKNEEDGGGRRFILIQLDEEVKEDSPGRKLGFRSVIEITVERMRRVIKGVPNSSDEELRQGLGGTFSYFELGDPIEMESILEGDKLPSYLDLARYVFYTATGEEFDTSAVDESRNFIGESKEYEVFLFYKPDLEYLKSTALTLDRAKALGAYKGKKRLVFAPTKYLNQDYLLEYHIDFAQLPFEIYRLRA